MNDKNKSLSIVDDKLFMAINQFRLNLTKETGSFMPIKKIKVSEKTWDVLFDRYADKYIHASAGSVVISLMIQGIEFFKGDLNEYD